MDKNLEKDLDKLKLHPQENLTELTQDRPAWRKMVQTNAALIPAQEVTAPPRMILVLSMGTAIVINMKKIC